MAELRAAHQLLDRPLVFDDPLALRILGVGDAAGLPARFTGSHWFIRSVRAFLAARSRYAEDGLRAAVDRHVRQYVILGAGLDTFGYRSPFGASVRVFEVDFPATQRWKQDTLRQAGIAIPPWLTFVPVDFEAVSVADGLGAAGFQSAEPAFFSWLGVTNYLQRETVLAMLRRIGRLPAGSGVVFDYGVSRSLLNGVERLVFDALATLVAEAGEPWITLFDPAELTADLLAAGFSAVEDLDGAGINARYLGGRQDGLTVGTLARLVNAVRS